MRYIVTLNKFRTGTPQLHASFTIPMNERPRIDDRIWYNGRTFYVQAVRDTRQSENA